MNTITLTEQQKQYLNDNYTKALADAIIQVSKDGYYTKIHAGLNEDMERAVYDYIIEDIVETTNEWYMTGVYDEDDCDEDGNANDDAEQIGALYSVEDVYDSPEYGDIYVDDDYDFYGVAINTLTYDLQQQIEEQIIEDTVVEFVKWNADVYKYLKTTGQIEDLDYYYRKYAEQYPLLMESYWMDIFFNTEEYQIYDSIWNSVNNAQWNACYNGVSDEEAAKYMERGIKNLKKWWIETTDERITNFRKHEIEALNDRKNDCYEFNTFYKGYNKFIDQQIEQRVQQAA